MTDDNVVPVASHCYAGGLAGRMGTYPPAVRGRAEHCAVTGAWIVRNGRECDLVADPCCAADALFQDSVAVNARRCRSQLLYSPLVGDGLFAR